MFVNSHLNIGEHMTLLAAQLLSIGEHMAVLVACLVLGYSQYEFLGEDNTE